MIKVESGEKEVKFYQNPLLTHPHKLLLVTHRWSNDQSKLRLERVNSDNETSSVEREVDQNSDNQTSSPGWALVQRHWVGEVDAFPAALVLWLNHGLGHHMRKPPIALIIWLNHVGLTTNSLDHMTKSKFTLTESDLSPHCTGWCLTVVLKMHTKTW